MTIALFTCSVVMWFSVLVTPQPPLPAARPMTPRLFPVVTQKLTAPAVGGVVQDRKSTRLNSSHTETSYAVFSFQKNDFIEAMYAFAFVLANFGIAMAAKV